MDVLIKGSGEWSVLVPLTLILKEVKVTSDLFPSMTSPAPLQSRDLLKARVPFNASSCPVVEEEISGGPWFLNETSSLRPLPYPTGDVPDETFGGRS